MKNYIGIDLGGTNVRVAKITEEGQILEMEIADSKAQESAEVIEANIVSLLKKFDLSDVSGIGIGVPGPVEQKLRVMTMASNIPSLLMYPLVENLEKFAGLPVYMDNDANVAGLAEAVVGSGKGNGIVYYITQSTGIGGALVINGKVVSGRKGYAGEIGNIIVKEDGEKINHLNKGAAEIEASGTAIGRKGARVFGEKGDTARKVFDLARSGDPKALELIDDMAHLFARMLANITTIVDPDCYVIGGGCSKSKDLYFHLVSKYHDELVHEATRNVPLYTATLKEPGVIGAAMLARSHDA